VLNLGPGFGAGGGGPLPITSSRMGCLLDALGRGYDVLGLGRAAGGDEVLRDLVLATRGRQRRRICGSADTNVYAYSPPSS